MPDDSIAPLLAQVAAVMPEGGWPGFVGKLPAPEARGLMERWGWQAHGGQGEPAGNWRIWLLMAGRGFGKTRCGAEWISARARENPGCAIALVGATAEEVARVMIEGESGILSVARADEKPVWQRTRGLLTFSSGAEARIYSAGAGEGLRGGQHHFAWADEVAKWRKPDRAWDNLQMGLRLGDSPRMIATTTPRRIALLGRIRKAAAYVETNGATGENEHLSAVVRDWLTQTYGGTRQGRQELDGVLLADADGALWTRDGLEAARRERPPVRDLARVVLGVDPPVSTDGDACGIVVAGMTRGGAFYVLDDRSVGGMRPEGWARAVAQAAADWGADRVVAEKNQGGDMVDSVLRAADARLPVTLVSASRGKAARAEPVALAFERGDAFLGGCFPALEDELAGLVTGGYAPVGEAGRSPDRADAMVWAMTELMRPRPVPRIRSF